jgi:hypothetical protein
MITILCARKTFLLLLLLQQKATEIQRAKACLTTEERRTHFQNFLVSLSRVVNPKHFSKQNGTQKVLVTFSTSHDANIVALFVLFEDHAEQPSARQHE